MNYVEEYILKLDTTNFQNLKFKDYYLNNSKYMRIIDYKDIKKKL